MMSTNEKEDATNMQGVKISPDVEAQAEASPTLEAQKQSQEDSGKYDERQTVHQLTSMKIM